MKNGIKSSFHSTSNKIFTTNLPQNNENSIINVGQQHDSPSDQGCQHNPRKAKIYIKKNLDTYDHKEIENCHQDIEKILLRNLILISKINNIRTYQLPSKMSSIDKFDAEISRPKNLHRSH